MAKLYQWRAFWTSCKMKNWGANYSTNTPSLKSSKSKPITVWSISLQSTPSVSQWPSSSGGTTGDFGSIFYSGFSSWLCWLYSSQLIKPCRRRWTSSSSLADESVSNMSLASSSCKWFWITFYSSSLSIIGSMPSKLSSSSACDAFANASAKSRPPADSSSTWISCSCYGDCTCFYTFLTLACFIYHYSSSACVVSFIGLP